MIKAVALAWPTIDVALKQRHDELPKLVEVCKQYKEARADVDLKALFS